MNIYLAIALVVAAVGWCDSYGEWRLRKMDREMHAKEIESINKVGRWYEARTHELEEENQLLAAQIVSAGSAPVRAQAMPFPDRDSDDEYAFDGTGLVVDRLDPRDRAIG